MKPIPDSQPDESTVSGYFLKHFEDKHGYPFDDEVALWRIPPNEMRLAIVWEYGREFDLIRRNTPDRWAKSNPQVAQEHPWLALSDDDKCDAANAASRLLGERWRFWVPSPIEFYSTDFFSRDYLAEIVPDVLAERRDVLNMKVPALLTIDISAPKTELMVAISDRLDSILLERRSQAQASVSAWLKATIKGAVPIDRETLWDELIDFLPSIQQTPALEDYLHGWIATGDLTGRFDELESGLHSIIEQMSEKEIERSVRPLKGGSKQLQTVLLNVGILRMMHHLERSTEHGELPLFDRVLTRMPLD